MYALSGLPSFAAIRTKPTTFVSRSTKKNKPQAQPIRITAMRAVVQRVASASVEVSLSLSLSLSLYLSVLSYASSAW